MSRWFGVPPADAEEAVRAALREDVGPGDLSVRGLEAHRGRYRIEVQAEGVVCGLGIAAQLLPDDGSSKFRDGDRVTTGDVVMAGEGGLAHILTHERTALNFLTALSGVATLTARFVAAVEGTGAQVVDTRKTTPGLRSLQKYAVRCGGGSNHRQGLFDAVMVKDNHIRAFGSISRAVSSLRRTSPHTCTVEVECETADQVAEALQAGANIVMLDNMPLFLMEEMVKKCDGRAITEASGGVNLSNVKSVAQCGVDLVSVGALTHSAPALSMHLELD